MGKNKKLKVLVGCEFSGRVRDAFQALGHDAWSCDLLPTETPGKHIVGDVLQVIDWGWDLAVFHPPCTYLANSGVLWLYGGKGKIKDENRWQCMLEGAEFFKALLNAPIPRIAVENPVMHGYAKKIIETEYSQIINPFDFGHMDSKKTCLWLKGLAPLMATLVTNGRSNDWHTNTIGNKDRRKLRSYTYPGIARAMANQWGGQV